MRDMVLLAILVGGTLWALKQPWIGAIMWTWVSLMSPHVEFGYAAASWPVASGVAGTTMLGLLLTKRKHNPLMGPVAWTTLAFTAWICITLPFSFYFDQSVGLWERSMKIFLMLFVTAALIDDKRKLEIFIWANVFSIAWYGVKGGIFTIITAGNYRIWGPGGFIGGNNELALALIMVIPLMRYLQLQQTNKWVKIGLTVAMGLSAVAALGTYSRGALLGVAAMGAFFWLKSDKKVMWGVLIAIIGVGALSVMPEQWWERMNTIKTYDADDSALGRINAWWMAFNLAKDKFFGGGFMIYEKAVFAIYSPDPTRVHAAHSIYFQVLGEHGFIGLFIWLSIGVATWMTARSLIKHARADARYAWAGTLGAMVQVSMIGYAVTGAFLSLTYFDLPYNIGFAAMLALHFVRQDIKARASAPAAAPVGAPAAPSTPPTAPVRGPAATARRTKPTQP